MLVRDSHGQYVTSSPVEEKAIIDLASKILLSHLRVAESITDTSKTRHFFQCKLANLEREVFAVLFLDSQHRIIEYEELFFGTVDSSTIHPREVVKCAIKHNASAVVFAHNHPSGSTKPSRADIGVTIRLKSALELIDVRVLDHIIVTVSTTTSMAALGQI